jgi:uncharacterized damage-inducible protein DinB
MEEPMLADDFRYDLWANLRWLRYVRDEALGDAAEEILRHILAAQTVWLERCKGGSPTAMPRPPLTEHELERLNAEWIHMIRETPDDRAVRYARLNGERLQTPFTTIARHVVNHGTYHRGELRGVCRSFGREDFPETDMVLFANLERR